MPMPKSLIYREWGLQILGDSEAPLGHKSPADLPWTIMGLIENDDLQA